MSNTITWQENAAAIASALIRGDEPGPDNIRIKQLAEAYIELSEKCNELYERLDEANKVLDGDLSLGELSEQPELIQRLIGQNELLRVKLHLAHQHMAEANEILRNHLSSTIGRGQESMSGENK
jgi:hypothetical protein